MKAAYGIVPLLLRGIDVRGQTVVLPELAEPEFRLPTIDICQDLVPSAPPWVVDFAHHGHDALTSAESVVARWPAQVRSTNTGH
jgi:hypothetical protein